MKLFFQQNDCPISGQFWQKNSFILLIYFLSYAYFDMYPSPNNYYSPSIYKQPFIILIEEFRNHLKLQQELFKNSEQHINMSIPILSISEFYQNEKKVYVSLQQIWSIYYPTTCVKNEDIFLANDVSKRILIGFLQNQYTKETCGSEELRRKISIFSWFFDICLFILSVSFFFKLPSLLSSVKVVFLLLSCY